MKQKTLFVAATAAEAKAAADHMQPGPIEYAKPELSAAVTDVLDRRREQVALGSTPEHDDKHDRGEILRDPHWGASIRLHAVVADRHPNSRDGLVDVAAMIIAEIERLDRRDGRT